MDVVPPPPQADSRTAEPYAVDGPPGRGAELWSSKALNLAWLPRCDNWHSPSLLSRAIPDAVWVENPPVPTAENRPVWFFRVTVEFGVWACRAIHRAGLAKADLPPGTVALVNVLKKYLESQKPGSWLEVERLALAPNPVVIPGADIIPRVVELARYGLAPRWDGWEKLAEKADAERQDIPTPPAPAAKSIPPKRRRSDGGQSNSLF